MRKFYLENQQGTQYDLNGRETCVLTAPSGLGVSETIDFIQIGDTFKASKRTQKQGTFQGTLNFMKPNHYDKYMQFAEFVYSSQQPLRMIYEAIEGRQYCRDVYVESIEKDEIDNQDDVLKCPIKMNFSTLYYKKNQERYIIKSDIAGMRYPYQLPAKNSDSSNFITSFKNNGQADAAFTFEFSGYADAPGISIIDSADVTVFSLTLADYVEAGEKIKYSSLDDDLYITKIDREGVETSLIGTYTDLNQRLFYKIPPGTFTIRFRKSDIEASQVNLQTFRYFRAV